MAKQLTFAQLALCLPFVSLAHLVSMGLGGVGLDAYYKKAWSTGTCPARRFTFPWGFSIKPYSDGSLKSWRTEACANSVSCLC